MADLTPNYNLEKATENEYYDVTLHGRNMDIIDAQLKANADAAEAKIPNSLATAADQVPVSSGVGAWAVKNLAQFKTWLGLKAAAFLDLDVEGGVASHNALAAHLADNAPHTDATNLIKTDGSNAMAASLNMGTNDIIGTNDADHFITKTFNSGGNSIGVYWYNGGAEYRLLYGGNVILFITGDGIIKLKNATTHGEVAGSPEGVVTAPVGSTRFRTNGGASTTLYVKESGSGNTGWKAVQTA